jgi:outer membrane protein assembly factor BamB
VAVGVAAVVVAGGLVTTAVVASAGCGGGGSTDAAVRPGAEAPSYLAHLDDREDARIAGGLTAAGVPATPLWHMWTGMRVEDSDAFTPDVTGAALVGDVLVTVQEDGRGRLAAGYAARTGELRWQRTLPPGSRAEVLPTGLVQTDRQLTAFDPATGELRWCAALPANGTTTVAAVPGALVVADQGTDGGDSHLRQLDPATGEERWSLDYSVHSAAEPPAVTPDTVSLFVTEADGTRSGTRTLALDTGRVLWGTSVDFPHPVAGAGDVVLLRSDAGLQGVDAATGRVRWTSAALDEELRSSGTLHVLPGLAVLLQDRKWVDELPVPSGLTAFDPATGEVRWRVEPGQLGLTDGQRVRTVDDLGDRLLVHADSGSLGAVETATGRVLGAAGDDELTGAAGDLAFSAGGNRVTVAELVDDSA